MASGLDCQRHEMAYGRSSAARQLESGRATPQHRTSWRSFPLTSPTVAAFGKRCNCRRMKPPPQGFHDLTSGLHQDALMFAEGSMEKLVENCIGFMPNHLKHDLRTYLSHQLQTKVAAELKGILNREKRAIVFNS